MLSNTGLKAESVNTKHRSGVHYMCCYTNKIIDESLTDYISSLSLKTSGWSLKCLKNIFIKEPPYQICHQRKKLSMDVRL